jgi:hypothetical protein
VPRIPSARRLLNQKYEKICAFGSEMRLDARFEHFFVRFVVSYWILKERSVISSSVEKGLTA